MIKLALGSFASAAAVFHRLASRRGAFWLDNAIEKQTSFMGCEPCAQLRITADRRVLLLDGDATRATAADPLEAIGRFVAAGAPVGSGPQAVPHTYGFLAYDLAPAIEPR